MNRFSMFWVLLVLSLQAESKDLSPNILLCDTGDIKAFGIQFVDDTYWAKVKLDLLRDGDPNYGDYLGDDEHFKATYRTKKGFIYLDFPLGMKEELLEYYNWRWEYKVNRESLLAEDYEGKITPCTISSLKEVKELFKKNYYQNEENRYKEDNNPKYKL